jgi:hypothetical protein
MPLLPVREEQKAKFRRIFYLDGPLFTANLIFKKRAGL